MAWLETPVLSPPTVRDWTCAGAAGASRAAGAPETSAVFVSVRALLGPLGASPTSSAWTAPLAVDSRVVAPVVRGGGAAVPDPLASGGVSAGETSARAKRAGLIDARNEASVKTATARPRPGRFHRQSAMVHTFRTLAPRLPL